MVRCQFPTRGKLVGGTGKVEAQVGTWFPRLLSLKSRVELYTVYIFSVVYASSARELLVGARTIPLLASMKGWQSRQVYCQHPCNRYLRMLYLARHWFVDKLAFLSGSLTGDTVWGRKVRATLPNLKSRSEVESRCKPKREAPYFRKYKNALCKLSRPRKVLYRVLVEGAVSDPLEKRLKVLLEEIRLHWNSVPEMSYLINSDFSIIWPVAQNAWQIYPTAPVAVDD